jgi:hypothetical protein
MVESMGPSHTKRTGTRRVRPLAHVNGIRPSIAHSHERSAKVSSKSLLRCLDAGKVQWHEKQAAAFDRSLRDLLGELEEQPNAYQRLLCEQAAFLAVVAASLAVEGLSIGLLTKGRVSKAVREYVEVSRLLAQTLAALGIGNRRRGSSKVAGSTLPDIAEMIARTGNPVRKNSHVVTKAGQ